MEADKVIEEPQTTMDAEEHPSSKDPSAEDSQEPLITETPLEPSISETPLEPLTPETLLEPSTSQTPLETHTSETSLKPSIPQTSLEPHAYETLLEPSTSKASTPESPLESHISKVPEKHLSFHNSSPGHSSMSSSDTLKEDFFSESSSRKPSWRRSAQTSESEILEQHSLSGPSAQVHLDTSAKEREEDEEKEEVDTSIGTTHTAQPGRHPGKKKKGISRYKAHPVVPAKQAELVEVAKAMHREKFGAQVNNLFQWEKNAALNAIQTGLYIGWRCPHYLWDCFRIGDESKCFCGHLLREHQIISDISVPCNVGQCRCLMFCFIPSRPEEVGCCCNCFESNFLCAACDRRWEEHETFFETEETRRRGGRPHGADYVPFAEMPTLRETIISNSDFKALQKQGPSGQRSSHPSPPGLPGSSSLKPGPTFDPRT
ncbi:protein FAM221B isoform X3 [Pteropus medius]|uniref:protein FAM221B isoform X3 n=1 Tax=Pteropus vampyrus TaxID=132908 RepID=UPI00196ADFE5|nr:protein FAM221B isoform X3 [Pteropus giganteus]